MKDNVPGARVSVDQLISAQPGLVPQSSGSLTRSRIFCSTIFVDHHSSFAFSFLQRSTTHEETLNAKAAFEKFALSFEVPIQAYHADNGRFAEAAFRDECNKCNQNISFCAVGAHHQNGIAKANIKTFTLGARTCLLHAKRLWPEAITTMLWLLGKYYVECHNHFHLDDNGKSPLMKFSKVDEMPSAADFHPFGCPVFVLESKLQSSTKGIPKWDPRASLGIYLGYSPSHAGSVALVLNPATGHVSPQYHVVFDDTFSTASNLRDGTAPKNWKDLVESSSYLSTDEDYNLADTWLRETTTDADDPNLFKNMIQGQPNAGTQVTASEGAMSKVSEGGECSPSEGENVLFSDPAFSQDCEGENSVPGVHFHPKYINLSETGCRRSTRDRSMTTKAAESYDPMTRAMHSFFTLFQFVGLTSLNSSLREAHATLSSVESEKNNSPEIYQSYMSQALERFHHLNSHFDKTLNVLSIFAFASANADNDTYSLREMLKQPDVSKFVEAMVKEIDDHVRREHWDIIPRSTMPTGTKTILAVWSFKRKRLHYGTITKWKARLCCHGGMQQWGVNY